MNVFNDFKEVSQFFFIFYPSLINLFLFGGSFKSYDDNIWIIFICNRNSTVPESFFRLFFQSNLRKSLSWILSKTINKFYFRIDEEGSDEEDEEGWTKVSTGAVDKPKMFEKDAEINHELVIQKLKEIMAARGKKRTNRKEQIELLSELLAIAEEHNLGIGVSAKIKFDIIKAIFDYNPKISGKISNLLESLKI